MRSKSELNNSQGGMRENRLIGIPVVGTGLSSEVGEGVERGGGGKEERSCTSVDRRYIPCVVSVQHGVSEMKGSGNFGQTIRYERTRNITHVPRVFEVTFRAFHRHKFSVTNEQQRAERTRFTPRMTSPMLKSTIKPTRSNEICRANEEIDSGVNPNGREDCSFGVSSERVAGDGARTHIRTFVTISG
jgi:hypothetical protein